MGHRPYEKQGELLHQYRKRAKMTQKEVSEQMGLSESSIKKYEYGEFAPRLEHVINMSDIYVLSQDESDELMGLYFPNTIQLVKREQIPIIERTELADGEVGQVEELIDYENSLIFEPWETTRVNGIEGCYIYLTSTLLLSSAALALSPFAFQALAYMYLEAGGEREFDMSGSHYFRWIGEREFRKAANELEEKGFIDRQEVNARIGTAFVFSCRWKEKS